jgi:pimeloyl-ACP methyl ester carboxylesterase
MYAAEYPGNVDQLVLLAPMPVRSKPYAAQAAERFIGRLNDSTWARLRALDAALPTASDPVEVCRELIAGTVAVPLYFANQEAADQFDGDFCDAPPESLRRVPFVRAAVTRARGNWDLRAALNNVSAQTLVVHGDQDAIPVAAARELVSALPNARLLLVSGADHLVFADGASQVIPAIVAFLRGEWPRDAQPIH